MVVLIKLVDIVVVVLESVVATWTEVKKNIGIMNIPKSSYKKRKICQNQQLRYDIAKQTKFNCLVHRLGKKNWSIFYSKKIWW